MTTIYTYQREIYDQTAFLTYIKGTLPTASNVYVSNGAINIVFPSSITKATLDTLVANFSNTTTAINTSSFRNISIGNTTSNILLATSNYTGYFEDVSDYSSITTSVYSDVPSSSNGFLFQFSSDGSNVDVSQSYTAKSGGYLQNFPIINRYIRVSYSNGNTPQTAFRLQSIYNYYKNTNPGQFANEKLTDASFLQLSKNILTGRNASGAYENIGAVGSKLNINVPITAAGTLSTCQDTPLIQLNFGYSINSDLTLSNVAGNATVTQSNNFALISSGTTSNSSAMLNSKKYVKFRIGQSIKTAMSIQFAPAVSNNYQISGVGNYNDGAYFGYNGSNFGIMRRYSGVDTWVYQNNWNFDKFDGTGPSGMILNPTFGNIYNIQYQYAYGHINYLIQEPFTGDKYLTHRYTNANVGSNLNFQIPSFPINIQSSNFGNTSNVIIKVGALAVFNEGLTKVLGPRFGDDNSKTLSTNAYNNVITLRNNTTFAGKSNFTPLTIKNLTASTDTRQAIISFFRNATIGGTTTFSNVDAVKSASSTDFTGTTVTGGTQLHSFCLGNSTGLSQVFEDFEITLEPGDTLTAAARIPTAANTTVSVAMSWVEDQ